ncbi:hypothetical protein ACHHYP_07913 [Achlya hypogyna]|uniref:Uncharacterized protein n=1 Tax=Achlya hypogyna TaxID=1202772 RepID=A0A1V9YQ81_ACHHY|nr:hypothetical protein ACHHYP_07913 [Achlya hypogyna]
MPLQARQYEERIVKLEQSLEMARLRYQCSSSGASAALRHGTDAGSETLMKNRQVNVLLETIKEERTQRLVDLEAAHLRERELRAMSTEATVATKGAMLAQEEASQSRAEIAGLRATVRCSSKLLQATEKDYLNIHKELEMTQQQLLETRRKLIAATDDVALWTDRYNQAMVDLHVAQMKLTQSAIGASAKESALTRGYGVVFAEADGEAVNIQRNPFHCVKQGASLLERVRYSS